MLSPSQLADHSRSHWGKGGDCSSSQVPGRTRQAQRHPCALNSPRITTTAITAGPDEAVLDETPFGVPAEHPRVDLEALEQLQFAAELAAHVTHDGNARCRRATR